MIDNACPAAFLFCHSFDEIHYNQSFPEARLTNLPRVDSHPVLCVLLTANFAAPDGFLHLVP